MELNENNFELIYRAYIASTRNVSFRSAAFRLLRYGYLRLAERLNSDTVHAFTMLYNALLSYFCIKLGWHLKTVKFCIAPT